MAGRIRIPPYKPLGINAQGVPTGGYYDIDAHAGFFNALPPVQLGLQAAQGAIGIAGAVSSHLASDNEATVKAADIKLGETEQALLFDPRTGYLNLRGRTALQQAPAVLDAYSEAQARTLDTAADDDQRRMLQELADKRLASFQEVVERHGAAQRQGWYDQVADQRIAAMNADAALHWSSDALLRRALGTARAEVRERAERKSWDSPLTEAALNRETSRVLASAIGAAVDRDPERARSLRTRYAAVIEDTDRAVLDTLLAEAQTRERAQAASEEILNAAPSEGHHPTPRWRVQRADAIPDPAVRAATIRRLNSATAAAEARARALGEQVLARVLNDGLTDPSQVPVGEWVALDATRRRAIEARLDHSAAGTEPASNPALVDELATEMTQAPHDFARRDLVPLVAHLPLPQWQRFRDWQAGLRRNDPATRDEVYVIKRGLQLADKIVPAIATDHEAADIRARLVEDIETDRRVSGKTLDDADITDMLTRYVPMRSYTTQADLWDQRVRTEATPLKFVPSVPRTSDDPAIVRIQDSDKPDDSRSGSRRDDLSPEEKQSWLELLIELLTRPELSTPVPGSPRGQMPVPRQPLPAPVPRRLPSTSPPPPTTRPASPPSRPVPPQAPAENSPAKIAPPTRTLPGTAAGHAIGGVFEGRTHLPNSPRRKKAPPGPPGTQRHHDIPRDNWKSDRRDPWGFSDEAKGHFDSKIIRVMTRDHSYDTDHREYNRLVSAAIQKHLDGPPPIDPAKMKTKDARKLYRAVIIDNPDVQLYRKKMAESYLEFQSRYPMWEE